VVAPLAAPAAAHSCPEGGPLARPPSLAARHCPEVGVEAAPRPLAEAVVLMPLMELQDPAPTCLPVMEAGGGRERLWATVCACR
jgi:hypothetical protein